MINPKLIEIYAIILRKATIPNLATWPVILAILIGPPNWEVSPVPLNIEITNSHDASITTIILDALKNDDTVKIAGFGTYKVAKRKARVGRNPRTGESIQIAASQKVKFLPAKSLKEMFNR